MKRIFVLVFMCILGCFSAFSTVIAGEPPIRILSVDGGGARGIIPLVVLNTLTTITGKPITKLFDVYAGASTGAIITAALVTPNPTLHKSLTVHDVLGLYIKELPKVFSTKKGRKLDLTKPLSDQKGLDVILGGLGS